MPTFRIGRKDISVFPGDKAGSPVIYLNTVSDEGRQVYEAAYEAITRRHPEP